MTFRNIKDDHANPPIFKQIGFEDRQTEDLVFSLTSQSDPKRFSTTIDGDKFLFFESRKRLMTLLVFSCFTHL